MRDREKKGTRVRSRRRRRGEKAMAKEVDNTRRKVEERDVKKIPLGLVKVSTLFFSLTRTFLTFSLIFN